MIKHLLAALSLAALSALAPLAQAATLVDTGTPDGNAVGALAFDAFDWVDAKVSVGHAADIDAIRGHILGGAAGETFDITLYAADGVQGPGTLLYTTTATYGASGWNGASGLGWNVAAGDYWVEFEIQGQDTLGSSSVTGALFDTGAPNPLATTASTPDAGFTYDVSPLSFGLQVSTVPWPSSAALMLAGVVLLSASSLARRRR
jgi:hypothetical protein